MSFLFKNFTDSVQTLPTESTMPEPDSKVGQLRLVSCLGIGVCLGFLAIIIATLSVFEYVRILCDDK